MRRLRETKVGRGWSGKLSNIDKLLAWMYDKEIMNEDERKEKDRIFYQYYRFYNDGDIPLGMDGMSNDEIELSIEEDLETFMRKILSKYNGKYDRRDFYFDDFIDSMDYIENVADRRDVHGVLYWVDKARLSKDSPLLMMMDEIEDLYDEWKQFLESTPQLQEFTSWSFPYTTREIEKMDLPKDVRKEVHRLQDPLEDYMADVSKMAKDLKRAATQSRRLLDVE